MIRFTLRASLAVLLVFPGGDAFGGRGGGGGGGRGGGGGGGRVGGGGGGGGMSRPSMGRNPGFSPPRQAMPSGGGGMYRAPQNFAPRPNFGANAPGVRPQVPANAIGRPPGGAIGANNRPIIGGNNIVNRPNYGGNTINNININNVRNNNFVGTNNWPGRSSYNGYHQNWVHGSWNNRYPNYNWGYFGGGFVAGMATWALASSLTSWGYSSYSNPYYMPSTIIVQQPVAVGQPMLAPSAYDYSQPINTVATAPEPTSAEAAVAIFDQAREAFRSGDYASALQQTQTALVKMPNDPTLHEFRALILFAQKQYDGAAAGLFAVLTAGPGWDWTTMVGLYPGVEVYTAQLRALETFTLSNPTSASSKFVLAYHYLTQGFPDNAASQLREVIKLQPGDTLSVKLLAGLEAKGSASASTLANNVPAEVPPADPVPAVPAATTVPPGSFTGTWTAKPVATTTITLNVGEDGKFSWEVGEQSGKRTLKGSSTFGNDMLTLTPDSGEALNGKITWRDANRFFFQAGGGGPNDPGLAFSKVSR